MRYRDADDLASAYFAGLDALTPLRAIDLRMIHAERCSRCGGGPGTERVRRHVRSRVDRAQWLAEWETVCATCSAPWEPEPWGDRCILRGPAKRIRMDSRRASQQIQYTPRADATEDAMVAAIDRRLRTWPRLVECMEPVPRRVGRAHWHLALAYWRAYLHPHGGTAEAVAWAASLHGIEATPAEVGRSLRHARHTVMLRAQRLKLIREGAMREATREEIDRELEALRARAAKAERLERFAIEAAVRRLEGYRRRAEQAEHGCEGGA